MPDFVSVISYLILIFRWKIFLSATRLPRGQLSANVEGGSLTNLILITAFFLFLIRPEGHREPRSEALKYWVEVQRGQSYLIGRRCVFSLGWSLF